MASYQIEAISLDGDPRRNFRLPVTHEDREDAEADALERNCKAFVPFYFQVEESD